MTFLKLQKFNNYKWPYNKQPLKNKQLQIKIIGKVPEVDFPKQN